MKTLKQKKIIKKKTIKHHNIISGKILHKKSREGWIYIEIYGEAYERGFAHGYLLYKELLNILNILPFKVKKDFNKKYEEYLEFSREFISPVVKIKYPEFYEEIRGIYEGLISRSKNNKYSIEDLIAWNAYMTLYSFFKDGKSDNKIEKCSAFIATGSATKTGEIIMAHNTHCNFIEGQFFNIILNIIPANGIAFKMQTAPGLISSTTDWFISDAGIMGCETTISTIKNKPRLFESPYFCRIRRVMQYGKTIDDCFNIMKKDNAGDYSCSWLFGNINTGEIARLELGVNNYTEERTTDGYYIGMNSAMNTAFRINETKNLEHKNSKFSVGSRFIRLEELIGNKYYGKITVSVARKIIADHYDSFKNKIIPNSRSICKHSELDNTELNPYSMSGAVDGKVVSSSMVKRGVFEARYGSSCGRIFSITEHIKKHPEFKEYLNYVSDFPSYKWIII